MFTIIFNGEPIQVKSTTLVDVLVEVNAPKPCAVAINGQFIPKAKHQKVLLQNKDTLDAFTPMQGG